MKTLAGIVAYLPDSDRLRENVAASVSQVDQVVIFVNGDASNDVVETVAQDFDHIALLRSHENLGIATGLSRIMSYAETNGFDWVLAIDQDSVCKPGLVGEYCKYLDLPHVGILTCLITDRNFSQAYGFGEEAYHEVERCITAGSFMSVDAYRHTDGYDERMFIDGVDWDICFNFRQHGYQIYRIDFDGVLQEVGHGKNVTLLGKKYIAYDESPLRNYYGARNWVYLAKKYPEYVSMGKNRMRELRVELIILLYEGDKIPKILNRWNGLRDATRMTPTTRDVQS